MDNAFKNMKIGIDVIEVSRFASFDEKSGLSKNIFTTREINDCKKKNMPESLAARFAAKEAVRKTIEENIKFNQIEIRIDKSGAPLVVFLNKTINDKYASIVSMSHISFIAQAVCLTHKKIRQQNYG